MFYEVWGSDKRLRVLVVTKHTENKFDLDAVATKTSGTSVNRAVQLYGLRETVMVLMQGGRDFSQGQNLTMDSAQAQIEKIRANWKKSGFTHLGDFRR